jgi:hypothetical protein
MTQSWLGTQSDWYPVNWHWCISRGERGSVTPPASENFVFFNAKIEKSTFSGVYSCSIYMNKDITPPCFWNFDIIGFTTPVSWRPSCAPVYSNDITRTKILSHAWKKPKKKKRKKYPVKGLCRINIRVCFLLYQAKNGKERQNYIVQLHEKKCERKAFIHVHLITVCMK